MILNLRTIILYNSYFIMMRRYCWRKSDVNPLWYLQREGAPGHGLTHAGPIYRYSINSTYAHGSHYVVLSYAHCQAGQ
ncbi:TPA: hypothetical protein MIP79_18820 [Klebsiella pneumoniae]|nr:hypothetical protein [Klebsiella pneumoniae]